MCVQNWQFVALPVPEIIGSTQKLGSLWIRPRSLFFKILMGTFECIGQFEVRSFTRSWDNSDCSFGRGLLTPDLGIEKEGRRGSGMVLFARALVTIMIPIGHHSNFSSSFTRFRDIATFVLQHATYSRPTSSLPKISPCSPGIRWTTFGLRRAKVLG